MPPHQRGIRVVWTRPTDPPLGLVLGLILGLFLELVQELALELALALATRFPQALGQFDRDVDRAMGADNGRTVGPQTA